MSRFYKLFLLVVVLTSIPLVLCIFLFLDSQKWGVLSTISIVILVIYGIIGGVQGFYTYAVLRTPMPLTPLKKAITDLEPISTHLQPSRIVLTALAFMLSIIAAVIFTMNVLAVVTPITTLHATQGDVHINKPGAYTISLNPPPREPNVQVIVTNALNGSIVRAVQVTRNQTLRLDDGTYRAVCDFQIDASGTYHVAIYHDDMIRGLAITPEISMTLACMLIGALVVAVCTFSYGAFGIINSGFRKRTVS